MALTIEDGTGVAGADSYASVADCSAYAVSYYGASLTGNTADKEAAIRRAFAYLNGLRWKGSRTNGRSQGGAWPRTDMIDCDGNAITSDEIPAEVIEAQHELARAEFQAPGVLSPQWSQRDALVTMEKADVVQVQYDTSRLRPGDDGVAIRVEAAMRRIECFLINGGKAVRQTAMAVV